MSREIVQRHAGLLETDGHQSAQLHIDEVKESDPPRTVRIHRSGTVEIVTGEETPVKVPIERMENPTRTARMMKKTTIVMKFFKIFGRSGVKY